METHLALDSDRIRIELEDEHIKCKSRVISIDVYFYWYFCLNNALFSVVLILDGISDIEVRCAFEEII